jgi:hypothetical protein
MGVFRWFLASAGTGTEQAVAEMSGGRFCVSSGQMLAVGLLVSRLLIAAGVGSTRCTAALLSMLLSAPGVGSFAVLSVSIYVDEH